MGFAFLRKSDKELWLPKLFDLLYENMRNIAPFELCYEQEKQAWLAVVSPALDKEPRQIILCFSQGELAGFLQYYTREKLLMIEELQFKPSFHRTLLLYGLLKFMHSVLPGDLQILEAYADKRNSYSFGLMKKLGMELCEEDPKSPFVHMRGPTDRVYQMLRR